MTPGVDLIKVGRKAQMHDAKLVKKDGHKALISSVRRKLLYEIHLRAWSYQLKHPEKFSKFSTDF
jgi:hypothetical protein